LLIITCIEVCTARPTFSAKSLASREHLLAAVAAELNRAGSRTARGKLWSKDTLRRVRQRIEQAAAQRERNELSDLERPHWGIF